MTWKFRGSPEWLTQIIWDSLTSDRNITTVHPTLTYFVHQETKMLSGQDINLKLTLRSKDGASRMMSIRVNAQAMKYNGIPTHNIQSIVQEKMLLPGQGLRLFSYTLTQCCVPKKLVKFHLKSQKVTKNKILPVSLPHRVPGDVQYVLLPCLFVSHRNDSAY